MNGAGEGEPRWRRYLRFHGRDAAADTEAELAFHIAERARLYEARGMTPEEAHRTAVDRMGDLDLVRRECAREDRSAEARRQRRERASTLTQDLRIGWRSLARRPGFATIAVLTLALGVGATAGIFGIVDAVLLRPLPYPTEDRVAVVWELGPEDAGRWTAAPGKIADWRRQAGSFAALAHLWPSSVTLTGTGEPERIPGVYASSELATVFGVSPLLGRWFSAEEVEGESRVAVLGHDLWVRAFAGDGEVLGRGIVVDGTRHDIVGVMPADFAPLGDADVWLPVGPLADARGAHYLRVAGLLEAGVTFEAAQGEMELIVERGAAAYPDTDAGYGIEIVPLREEELGDARPVLRLWLGAVVFVLLIGAANLANLLLARISTRMPEIALRRSLGASRLRVVRQLLTENLVLAAVAGVVAIGLALALQRVILSLQPGTLPRLDDVAVDGRVVLVAMGLAVAGALVAGLLPALRLSRLSGSALVDGIGRRTAGGIGRDRLMTGLIVGEIGIAVVLTVGAALFIQTLRELNAVDPGFATEGRVAFRVSLPQSRYGTDEQVWSFYRDLREELQSIPGVDAVAASNGIPLEAVPWFQASGIVAGPDGEPPSMSAPFRIVTPGYFDALGISILEGRPIDESDRAEAPMAVVVERRLAESFFPGGDALGERVRISYGDLIDARVVGIAADVRQYGLGSAETPGLYVASNQVRWSSHTFVLRTSQPLDVVASAIRERVDRLDADLPVYGLATIEDRLATSLGEQRFRMTLLSTFAGLALLLGVVGVYGVLSYAVTQRSREIGIRLALGANPGRVVGSIVRWGALLGAAGIAIGLAASYGMTTLVEDLLFEVGARDPVIFIVVGVSTALAVVAASWLPARRAALVDPTETLRRE
ncbi:MAG: ABC transporter permease [Gemmatimonadota bacterium]|nr:ABC transporter permease [Gemmatimonadota bacterium]